MIQMTVKINVKLYKNIVSSMSVIRPAEAESHHFLNINNQQTEITFRYYSPPKCLESQTSNISNRRERSGGAKSHDYDSNESPIQQELTIIRQNIGGEKVSHTPEKCSDKFYDSKISEIKLLTLDAYEQLHNKLLRQNLAHKQNKTIKLRLISPSVDKSRQKLNTAKSYIKRVQINLKPAQQIRRRQAQGPRFRQLNDSQKGRKNIAIRLYEPNNYNHRNRSDSKHSQCNSYLTPRRQSCSHRKGITVYSTSTRKQSIPDDDHFSNNMNSCPPELEEKGHQAHATTSSSVPKHQNISLTNRKEKKTLRERYGEQFVQQLKRKAEKTRKRVYSKSKLGCKDKPIERAASTRKFKVQA